MKLNKLILDNFRNYNDLDITFDKDVVCFTGLNGQGKTNLIEAISVLGLLNSFRTNNYDEMKKFGEEYFFISGEFTDKNDNRLSIKISYSDKKKKVTFQDKKILKFSDFWGNIPIVYLIPDESVITTGPPLERRKFVDKLLSMIDREYFSLLKNYSKIIKQKNKILFDLKKENSFQTEMIDVYNDQIVLYGSKLFEKRVEFLKGFEKFFKDILIFISDGLFGGSISYSSEMDQKSYSSDLREKLSVNKRTEVYRGLSIIGPHKDDLIFDINGNDLRKYGSKGQHKLFLVALKLSEIKYIKSITDEYPVFLLDDLYSEIDEKKSAKIAKILDEDIQTFITTSNSGIIKQFDQNNTKIFNVINGAVNLV
ncbi:MAG: DNA replication/repair protein RecF [Candidatus Delongbacteria bacterium]|nr:DNA replication/repair protein RecF [Candidatus Delongbacteria bacterium]